MCGPRPIAVPPAVPAFLLASFGLAGPGLFCILRVLFLVFVWRWHGALGAGIDVYKMGRLSLQARVLIES